jgi:hypothetical protein
VANPSFGKVDKILKSANKTKNIYLLDDSRSKNKKLDELEILIRKKK